VLDARLVAAKWYLGELSGEEMPGLACQALESGYDGKNLRYLAGLSRGQNRRTPTCMDSAGGLNRSTQHHLI
jgi:hypothetical protein